MAKLNIDKIVESSKGKWVKFGDSESEFRIMPFTSGKVISYLRENQVYDFDDAKIGAIDQEGKTEEDISKEVQKHVKINSNIDEKAFIAEVLVTDWRNISNEAGEDVPFSKDLLYNMVDDITISTFILQTSRKLGEEEAERIKQSVGKSQNSS